MFNFVDLNKTSRQFMLEAIEEAQQSDNIYFSKKFNENGIKQWLSLLKLAASEHNEHWLSFKLEENQLFSLFEGAQKPSGGYTIKHIPHTAAETIAEGQFNRFYILGLCKLAKSKNIDNLIIYRAKESRNPRPESESLINSTISVDEIEEQLKDTQASFKSKLIQPNSGISLKLP